VTAAELAAGSVAASEILDTTCTWFKSQSINPTEAQATNDFINLIDNTINTTDAAEDDYIIPVAITVHSLLVDVDVAPGAGDQWAITLNDDGATTAVTCAIADTTTTCNSAALTAAVAAGSDMTILVSSAGGASDPTAAAQMRVSFCMAP
jgi:hypothetical protein